MDDHYELLAKLYLRLKGYVVSNLIIHSNVQGDSKSELDIIAIRMPFHSQEYRAVNVEDYLETSKDSIEIIIADVKNRGKLKRAKFNEGLRNNKNSIKQLIDWLGIYKSVTTNEIENFEEFLNLHRKKDRDGFFTLNEINTIGNFSVKFTFFCPQLEKWGGKGFKYIHGEEMIDFCWECLKEDKIVEECSRRYDFKRWNELKPYVLFFKGKEQKVTKQDFENHFKDIKVKYE